MSYFNDMEKNFLQKVNVDLLKTELHLDVNGLSQLLGVSTQTIYKWNRDKDNGGCRPTYDTILVLLKNGASLESLFGIQNFKGSLSSEKQATNEDFIAGVREALRQLAEK